MPRTPVDVKSDGVFSQASARAHSSRQPLCGRSKAIARAAFQNSGSRLVGAGETRVIGLRLTSTRSQRLTPSQLSDMEVIVEGDETLAFWPLGRGGGRRRRCDVGELVDGWHLLTHSCWQPPMLPRGPRRVLAHQRRAAGRRPDPTLGWSKAERLGKQLREADQCRRSARRRLGGRSAARPGDVQQLALGANCTSSALLTS